MHGGAAGSGAPTGNTNAGHSGAMLEAGCTQVFDRMERLAEFLVVRIHTRLDHQGRSK
jgi:hypothetical protein